MTMKSQSQSQQSQSRTLGTLTITTILVAASALTLLAQQLSREEYDALLLHRQLINRLITEYETAHPIDPVITTEVPPSADLQTFIDGAPANSILLLPTGATYGQIVLPTKTGTVTIKGQAEIRSGAVNVPAIQVSGHNWRVQGLSADQKLTITAAHASTDLVRVGTSTQSASQVPVTSIFQWVHLKGDPITGNKRGIVMNGSNTQLLDSRCDNIKGAGYDTQCVAGWNGPGPFVVRGNHLEAAGEVIMFGGADPSIPDLIPSDITIEKNVLTRPMAWKGMTWTVKNLFELKAAQRVVFINNDLSNHWVASQSGPAIVLKSVNQDGNQPWARVYDVLVKDNRISNVSAVANLAGNPGPNPAVPMSLVSFVNNQMGTDHVNLGGTGNCFLIQGVADLTIDRNTMACSGSVTIQFDGPASPGLKLTGSVLVDNAYSIKGSGTGEGVATLNAFAPGWVFTGNMVQTASPQLYPAGSGNVYVATLPTPTTGYGYQPPTPPASQP
jgi:hypothetical protein